jgi:hypothetical protein
MAQNDGRVGSNRPSVSEPTQFIGERCQIVAVDPLYNLAPTLIHSVRVHGAEDTAGNGGYRVAVSADVCSEEDRVLSRLQRYRESQC